MLRIDPKYLVDCKPPTEAEKDHAAYYLENRNRDATNHAICYERLKNLIDEVELKENRDANN